MEMDGVAYFTVEATITKDAQEFTVAPVGGVLKSISGASIMGKVDGIQNLLPR